MQAYGPRARQNRATDAASRRRGIRPPVSPLGRGIRSLCTPESTADTLTAMSDARPRFAGPEGLWNADPVELATALFLQAFTPIGGEALPSRRIELLNDDLAALCGIGLPAMRVRTAQPLAMLSQLALDCVLIWERARVAARHTGGGGPIVNSSAEMLRMGTVVLQSADPVATMRQLLTATIQQR